MDKVMVETSRIRTHCFVGGPTDGVPVLDRYQAGGGSVRELVLEGCGHGPPIERSAEVRELLLAHIRDAA
jgi:pimeloyl-ACP methyl ester carboxylesterase